MKKLFFSICASLLIVSATNAQTFRLGAKAGANMSKIQGQSFNDGFNLGYHLGGFAEIDFSKHFGIQPEVIFNQSSTKYEQHSSAIFDNLKSGDNIQLNYLSIPILLRINAGNLLTFHVGPQFGVLINNHETTYENGKDAFKKGDFGMIGGLQLNLKPLRVYGRYNIGLSDINDIGSQGKWKSEQIQLGIGLKI